MQFIGLCAIDIHPFSVTWCAVCCLAFPGYVHSNQSRLSECVQSAHTWLCVSSSSFCICLSRCTENNTASIGIFFFPFSFLSPTRHRLISVRFVMISGIRYAHALRIFTSEEFSHGDFFLVVIFVMSAVCGSCLFSWCWDQMRSSLRSFVVGDVIWCVLLCVLLLLVMWSDAFVLRSLIVGEVIWCVSLSVVSLLVLWSDAFVSRSFIVGVVIWCVCFAFFHCWCCDQVRLFCILSLLVKSPDAFLFAFFHCWCCDLMRSSLRSFIVGVVIRYVCFAFFHCWWSHLMRFSLRFFHCVRKEVSSWFPSVDTEVLCWFPSVDTEVLCWCPG